MTVSDWWLVVWVAAIGSVVAAMAWRGCLQADVFAAVPRRRVDLTLLDVLVAVMIMFVGVAMLTEIRQMFGQVETDTDPQAIAAWTLASQALTQLSVVAFILWRIGGDGLEFGLWPRRAKLEIRAASLALPAALVLALGLSAVSVSVGRWLGQPDPDESHMLLRALLAARRPQVIFMLLVSAVAVAPLLEELIFRGLIQTALTNFDRRGRRWVVIVVSAMLFTLFHTGAAWQVGLSLFVLGLILGWLYERYGSLLPGLIVHAGFNAVNTAMTLVIGAGGKAEI